MNFSEEQVAFRDTVRRMAEKHVAPIAAEIDETDRFPTEIDLVASLDGPIIGHRLERDLEHPISAAIAPELLA